jgi:hypothetical protein
MRGTRKVRPCYTSGRWMELSLFCVMSTVEVVGGSPGKPCQWFAGVLAAAPSANDAAACEFEDFVGVCRTCTRCPCGGRTAGRRPRTYNGQRRRDKADPVVSMQVNSRVTCCRGEFCKTVGSAYVGSNPTPATTCENGPLARNSRLCGPFLLCPVVCHLVALRAAVSRCPRTHSGRDSCPITVGAHRRLFHGRPRTGRAGGRFLT